MGFEDGDRNELWGVRNRSLALLENAPDYKENVYGSPDVTVTPNNLRRQLDRIEAKLDALAAQVKGIQTQSVTLTPAQLQALGDRFAVATKALVSPLGDAYRAAADVLYAAGITS